MTTYSTVACVRHLLQSEQFGFVLTRKFSSDAIESLFRTLRRSQGCNDQMNVRSTVHALERILKTGIITASKHSNVSHAVAMQSSAPVNVPRLPQPEVRMELPTKAESALRKPIEPRPAQLTSLELAATAHVGGYIARVVTEKVHCEYCCQLVLKAQSGQAMQAITKHQDRGGLIYPSDDLVYLLDILKQFAEAVLSEQPKTWKPLESLLHFAVPVVCECPLLRCKDNNPHHRLEFSG